AGWKMGRGRFQVRSTTATAAAGTARSLYLDTEDEYLFYEFESVRPKHISYWVNTTSNGAGYLDILGPGFEVAAISFYNNRISVNGTGTVAAVPNRWYHIELRDIDWVNSRYTFYVDGVAN